MQRSHIVDTGADTIVLRILNRLFVVRLFFLIRRVLIPVNTFANNAVTKRGGEGDEVTPSFIADLVHAIPMEQR